MHDQFKTEIKRMLHFEVPEPKTTKWTSLQSNMQVRATVRPWFALGNCITMVEYLPIRKIPAWVTNPSEVFLGEAQVSVLTPYLDFIANHRPAKTTY